MKNEKLLTPQKCSIRSSVGLARKKKRHFCSDQELGHILDFNSKFLTCPKCNSELRKVEVDIEDAKTPAISYQCKDCDYYSFEPESTMKIINEIKQKESPLKIKQKIIKLSKDRLGMYFNKDVIDCLKLKSGEEVFVSVPNNKRIVLDIVK